MKLFDSIETFTVRTSTTRWRQSSFCWLEASRASYHRVFFGVVLRDNDVVIGDFAFVCCILLSIPHDVVQVWKVVIQIDSFEGISSFSPAGQLRALQWTV